MCSRAVRVSDTISYAYSMEGVSVNLMTGVARGGEAGGDSFGDPECGMEYDQRYRERSGLHDTTTISPVMVMR